MLLEIVRRGRRPGKGAERDIEGLRARETRDIYFILGQLALVTRWRASKQIMRSLTDLCSSCAMAGARVPQLGSGTKTRLRMNHRWYDRSLVVLHRASRGREG